MVQRVLRDQLTRQFKSVWVVDNEEIYESVVRFVQRFQPGLVNRVKLYTRSNPIFDEFNVTAELEKALRPKVWLKSGGYIVINQTEALVAIDVNTGKFVQVEPRNRRDPAGGAQDRQSGGRQRRHAARESGSGKGAEVEPE